MIDSDVINPDAGARAVSPNVAVSETRVGAYATFVALSLAGDAAVFGFGDGTLRRLALQARGEAAAPGTLCDLGAMPLAAATDLDGTSVLVGTDDGRLVACRATGRLETLVESSDMWIEHVAVHRGAGRRAYSAGRAVHVIDAGGSPVRVLEDHPSTVAGLAFSPDGARMAVAHYGGISVWPLDAGGAPDRLSWRGSHTAVTWSPNGRFIVTAMQDKEMHCWRMPERKSMRMSGYPSKIRSLSWTADSAYIAAGGADSVTSWNCEGEGPTGTPPVEFGYVFNGIVTQVAAHPGSRIVAGGYDDGTVLIGNIEKDDTVIARPGGGAAITVLFWSPDGETLIAGTEKGDVAVMRLEKTTV